MVIHHQWFFSGSHNAVFFPLFFTTETSQAIQNLLDFLILPFCGSGTIVLREQTYLLFSGLGKGSDCIFVFLLPAAREA